MEDVTSLVTSDSNSTIKAKVRLSALGVTNESTLKKVVTSSSNLFFGEDFYFTKDLTSTHKIMSEQLKVEIIDSSVFGQSIGMFSVPISEFYFEKEHTIRHRWYILFNPKSDLSQATGYVKLSTTLIKSGDNLPLLSPESPEERLRNLSKSNMEVSPQFKLQKRYLRISLFYLDRLVEMDNSLLEGKGKSDPYLIARIGAVWAITSVKSGVNTSKGPALFGEKIHLVYAIPNYINELTLEMKDKDYTEDETFGTVTIPLNTIRDGKYTNPSWVYFYGAQCEVDNKQEKQNMNTYSELASRFKGALYLKIEESKESFGNRSPCEFLEQKSLAENPAPTIFIAQIRIYFITNITYLNECSDGHELRIDWGGNITNFNLGNLNNGSYLPYEFFELREGFRIPEMKGSEDVDSYTKKNVEQLPDIIISLFNLKKKKSVSYLRLKAKSFYSSTTGAQRNQPMNLSLLVDPEYKELESSGGGVLCFKMKVFHNSQDGGLGREYFRGKARPDNKPIYLCVNAFQAKQLYASDNNSLSDPLAIFSHLGNSVRTKTIKCSLNPVWGERLIITTTLVIFEGEELPAPLIVRVYDYDEKRLLKTSSLEFLGGTIIQVNFSKISLDYSNISKPKWFNLKYDGAHSQGQLLVSCSAHKIAPPNIPGQLKLLYEEKDLTQYYIKIKMLGLRNLNVGLLSSPPSITFDVSSLSNGKSSGDMYSRYVCEGRGSASNPTICQVLK